MPPNLNVHTSSDSLYVQVAYNMFLYSLLELGPQALHYPFSWGSWGSPPLWWTGLQDCPTTHRHAHFMLLCLNSCNFSGDGQNAQHLQPSSNPDDAQNMIQPSDVVPLCLCWMEYRGDIRLAHVLLCSPSVPAPL